MNQKIKVAIIFPKYNPNDASHFPYWYKVFEKAGEFLDIYILFESGMVGHFNNCQTYTQKIQTKPFNLLERFFLITKLRIQGYKYFYIHYSIFSLFISKIITIIFGGKTFLWDCEFYEHKTKNKLQEYAIKITDILVTGHQKIANQYLKIYKLENKPVKIVRNWIDIYNDNRIKKRESRQNILFVHCLSERKGSRELPKIVSKILELDNSIIFTIVGNGPDFDYLNKWIINKKLQNKVFLKGELPKKEADNEFLKADILILPSRSEGFPRVILEAIKFKLSFVAYGVGCVKEISPKSESAYIVRNRNIEEFCNKIMNLLKMDNFNKIKLLSEFDYIINKYTLDKAVDDFISLFKNK